MRLANIDWSSDGTVFLVSIFVLSMVLAVLLERVSPKRKSKRTLNGRSTSRELID